MKRNFLILVGAAVCGFFTSCPAVFAQGTAFTYQGRLNDGTNAANGRYDQRFALFDAVTGGNQVGAPLTNSATTVSNGLFTVQLDFGAGVFNANARWLEIGVRTNGNGAFTTLSPRQPVTPAPYAIFANTASNMSGTVGNGQLANSAITLNAGTGLGGGGTVALGGSTTLSNTGIISVTGNADVTAATLNGAVTLGDSATSVSTPNTIIKRDASGNFSAGSTTLNNNLNLPATTASAGIIYSGGQTLLHDFGTRNFFGGPGAGNLTLTGSDNTGIGYAALSANNSGNDNTGIGYAALLANKSGSDNTASGAYALEVNTTGGYNTADGYAALSSNTNGSYNAANGYEALENNTSGSDNTANGASTLTKNTSGNDNTASGYESLYSNSNGSENTANGSSVLVNNTSGSFNTASGYKSLYSNTNGSDNTANGFATLVNNTSGSFNTASGNDALYSNTSGNNNTANGWQALVNNTNGSLNIALGYRSGQNLTNGDNNIMIGNPGVNGDNNQIRIGTPGTHTNAFLAGISGVNIAGGSEVYVNSAGQLGIRNFTGAFNTALGPSLSPNTTGSYNTAAGVEALFVNTSGSYNTALGYLALFANTTGSDNTAIGQSALQGNTSGSENIAVGAGAGASLTSESNNIDIGNTGFAGDGKTVRIGTQGTHTNAFIAGIYDTTLSTGNAVYVNSAGQLGTGVSITATNYVSKSGDTMTGPLVVLPTNGLAVGGNVLVVTNGFVGIGTSNPLPRRITNSPPHLSGLDVNGDILIEGIELDAAGALNIQGGYSNVQGADITFNGGSLGGDVYIGAGAYGTHNLIVDGNANVHSLTIIGGSDVAEPFKMSVHEIPKGSVVIIDEDNPGQLKLSERAYDTRVAGIVSGANGIHPGISLSQKGALEGGENVALSGRVYALADASTSAIKPGDLLTTSPTPGHAMKVDDRDKAHGAILGKAMTGLKEGRGMVLVLVSLQ